jgi:Ribonuclease HII
MMNELFQFDAAIPDRPLCGVDEAGRGPLAGSVFAAAVVLKRSALDCAELDILNDSKKLTEKKREVLYDFITANSYWAVAFADISEIEERNILGATHLAMQRAVAELAQQVTPKTVIIDGNSLPVLPFPAYTLVKGDGKSACIAAASVLAKVSRDREMIKLAELYPQYGFENHKGYGSKAHVAALKEHGPCEIHRPSFLTKILPEQFPPKKTAKRAFGDMGEDVACKLLQSLGYEITHRNFNCSAGEIDIAATKDGVLHIVEVKTRMKDKDFPAQGAVNAVKSRRISRAVDEFLTKNDSAMPISLDIISVEIDRFSGEQEVKHITNAYEYIAE